MKSVLKYFTRTKDDVSVKHFRKHSVSTISINEDQNDSVYGITTPKQLIMNDIKAGRPISPYLMGYISTNLNEDDKYDLIIEYNKLITNNYNLHQLGEQDY
jgi:hypothetical protein